MSTTNRVELSRSDVSNIMAFIPNSFLYTSIDKHWHDHTKQLLLNELRNRAKAVESGVYHRVRTRSRRNNTPGSSLTDTGNLRITKDHSTWPYLTSLNRIVESVSRYEQEIDSIPADFIGKLHKAIGRSGSIEVAAHALIRIPSTHQQQFYIQVTVGAIESENIVLLHWILKNIPQSLTSYAQNLTYLQQAARTSKSMALNCIIQCVTNILSDGVRQKVLNIIAVTGNMNAFQRFYTDYCDQSDLTKFTIIGAIMHESSESVLQFILSVLHPTRFRNLQDIMLIVVVTAAWYDKKDILQWSATRQPMFPRDMIVAYTNQYKLQYVGDSRIINMYHNQIESQELRAIRGNIHIWVEFLNIVSSSFHCSFYNLI